MSTRVKGANQFTAIAGEHFVAGELSKLGWVATLTAKNTPGFDILAARPDGHMVRIDVKTRGPSQAYSWSCGAVHIDGKHDFVVFVDLGRSEDTPEYWIVPARTARSLIRDYGSRKQMRTKDIEEYQEAWELLDR